MQQRYRPSEGFDAVWGGGFRVGLLDPTLNHTLGIWFKVEGPASKQPHSWHCNCMAWGFRVGLLGWVFRVGLLDLEAAGKPISRLSI